MRRSIHRSFHHSAIASQFIQREAKYRTLVRHNSFQLFISRKDAKVYTQGAKLTLRLGESFASLREIFCVKPLNLLIKVS